MIIINADDWGRSRAETDAALNCFTAGRISSVTAMVFMEDSARAAELAKETAIDVGLHLNLGESFSRNDVPQQLRVRHERIVKFLRGGRYHQLLYHPLLRQAFREVYDAQAAEFERLYGKPPSHIDGHRHLHLCSNVLLDGIIPSGQRVRRSFSFWPGEKGAFNRAYRRFVDWKLSRKYRLTDYFFALSQYLQHERLIRISHLARDASVELMTHPVIRTEHAFLASDRFGAFLKGLKLDTYASV
jgi:predicted glycoside hydrolase/deacetylase ChbG (UPF0249 family)